MVWEDGRWEARQPLVWEDREWEALRPVEEMDAAAEWGKKEGGDGEQAGRKERWSKARD